MTDIIDFSVFYERACERKGGEAAMRAMLPEVVSDTELAKVTDDRVLSLMTRCIFRAGFVWQIIDRKWPQFEEAFSGFVPLYWQQVPPERLEELAQDERIVRNYQKILTVPVNARMIVEIEEDYGSFGQFLANWPHDDQVGLLLFLKKNGARLGGNTGQYLLRLLGWDGFVCSSDVLTALRNFKLLDASPTSKKGLTQIQATINYWHQETGLPRSHISRILSYSVG
ncbi:DNA-3-methyladenine glycosylase I [Idiomarina aquatica]|uniref:DNA-3-methyladenine glycosylase I n=1 Tax=Idiomarina aquatica TaxID=1327752 RepID=A0A4R6PHY6_9GAMM|nr:DNA-3-methyladenine glycosylase I [Idiomarina aquatica]TDP37641.1 DNA-3-methyladenine glycosylase I [Idiomarina aquatica]